jgi:AraC family transcriptional regulator
MQPRIITLEEKTLIGISMKMSVMNNKTGMLWGTFSPRISEIESRLSSDKFSLQVYGGDYFKSFNPNAEFIKWAAVEVADTRYVPAGMEVLVLEGGLYAVFDYKGSSGDSTIFQYIFQQWVPNSPYRIDSRPHFEVLGENYRNNDPESEEEIWIPIIEKQGA